ncbi:hypothetical protein NKI46_29395 [Mesorhizobium sp. M0615]|uniref:hypothetical protein n=1 Tax=unclassified Mesorhizobium TaxID=325217 RepID=UPI002476604B|nr:MULTISPECIES: hypothetical protein [unclassified Mesorhizobium]
MRHEGTSRLFEAGFSIEQVAMVTGHKDWKMLRRYTHLRPEQLHVIAARLQQTPPHTELRKAPTLCAGNEIRRSSTGRYRASTRVSSFPGRPSKKRPTGTSSELAIS